MFLSQQVGSRSRFSPLLMDEGEYYFDDYEATYYPTHARDQISLRLKQNGRLKICSKSVLFAPDNVKHPVVRFQYEHVTGFGKWNGSLLRHLPGAEVFNLRTEKHSECKTGNQNHPYHYVKEETEYRFSLEFEKLINFLPKLQNLLRISQSPAEDIEPQLQILIDQKESQVQFNSTWLVNLSEKILYETAGNRLTPLVKNPGRVVITTQRLYFQPLNNAGPNPVDRYDLSALRRLMPRRHVLRHIGLEFMFKDGNNVYLSFKDSKTRDLVYNKVQGLPVIPEIPSNDLELTAKRWQNKEISNYDYLMYLNTMAHRSINDLTQYPVFPWIISDYTSKKLDLNSPRTFRDLSKPIGALNEERLIQLRMRFQEMVGMEGQTPFLYGTHYSAPGYVLYYLVREAPEYMLRLQSGKFDAPDRMFHSLEEAWKGVLTNASDVKELIPEFYHGNGDFLTNSQGLPLGKKSNGDSLNDVVLPPWASSPLEFVEKCREALESDFVSKNLHKWIDLIFGYAQTGQSAIDHDNVFYYITYEGAVDIEKIYDPMERKSIEAQINEFGQTPHKLFNKPHPSRVPIDSPPPPITRETKPLEPVVERKPQGSVLADIPTIETMPTIETLDLSPVKPTTLKWPDLMNLTCKYSYKLHRSGITDMCLARDGTTLYSVAKNGALKIFDIKKRKQTRNIALSKLALTSCELSDKENQILTTSFDHSVYMFSFEVSTRTPYRVHEEAVSCLTRNGSVVVSGSWDGTVKSWELTDSGLLETSTFGTSFECDGEITCLALSQDGNYCVVGIQSGQISLVDRRDPDEVKTLKVSKEAITAVAFSADCRTIYASSKEGFISLVSVTKWKKQVDLEAGEPILSMVTDGGHHMLVGTERGRAQIWDLGPRKILHSLSDMTNEQKDITCFAITKDLLVTGSSDCTICVWS